MQYVQADGAVIGIEILSSSYRTPRGATVGDRVKEVRRAYGDPTYEFAGNLQDELSTPETFDRHQLSFVIARQKVQRIWLFYPVQ